ncbi:hypothetical protein GALMADRAFT_775520 [Galerina marginata CBS 339.88]|uniref:Uncharacterized protein n=1 Tax=Galerina marginata (strain CBS 339.88) TaxID=685588 RepID=A0A067SNS9_GALM3|nr:hypothetical protein GALMADRAFT_775520 [Galerina marginata CBS 339.88]
MRLLDVNTLNIEEFFNEMDCPTYAILSHTWGDGEVSLQDFSTPAATSMAGYRKIENCCKQARKDGFDYVWIDTCCIDKTSSAELSEAINSMYKWYKRARVCYVYLSDVPTDDDTSAKGSKFSSSRWFERGWTLQELLAPTSVVFYGRDWVEIGTKYSLREEISNATRIPCEVLLSQSLDEICIAQRMSWAARRETTRVEDAAYSLMGIFNVNMPILYGEGWKAFFRLQHEIMKDSDDHTLFAWVVEDGLGLEKFPIEDRINDDGNVVKVVVVGESFLNNDVHAGLLASSPKHFRYSQTVRRRDVPGQKHPFSMTNNGLHIRLLLLPVPRARNEYQAILDCTVVGQKGPLVIYLEADDSGQYHRTALSQAHPTYTHNIMINHPKPVDIYVKAIYLSPRPVDYRRSFPSYTCHLSLNSPTEPQFIVLEGCYDPRYIKFDPPIIGCNAEERLESVRRKESNASQFCAAVLRLGIDSHPACQVILALGCVGRDSKVGCTLIDLPPAVTFPELWGHINCEGGLESDLGNVDRVTRQLTTGHVISAAIRHGALTPITRNDHWDPEDWDTCLPDLPNFREYVTIEVTTSSPTTLLVPRPPPVASFLPLIFVVSISQVGIWRSGRYHCYQKSLADPDTSPSHLGEQPGMDPISGKGVSINHRFIYRIWSIHGQIFTPHRTPCNCNGRQVRIVSGSGWPVKLG